MKNNHLLERIRERKAIILCEGRSEPKHISASQSYAAYPYGDRRRRPVSWIDQSTLLRLLAEGSVEKTAKGYEIVRSAAQRLQAGQIGISNAHAAQHRSMVRENLSTENGSFRPVNMNKNSQSVIRRLARQVDNQGLPFLNASEIEAGERFQADYARSTMSMMSRQSYGRISSAGASGGMSINSPENLSNAALDARQRVMDALDYVGPGLSNAVQAICCKDMGLEDMEMAEGWTRRSGKTVLKLGLQRLADFYGTVAGERSQSACRL